MKYRRTRQLDTLEAALRDAKDHPTASQLHERVSRSVPGVSLGTVYRNLQKLVDHQRAIPVHIGGEATRYDGMLAPHDHFVCEVCEGVIDLAEGMEPPVDTRRLKRAGFEVRSHRLAIFGVCRACTNGNGRRRARV